MSATQPAPNHQSILDDAWDSVVGGMAWLKSVVYGEFADHRPLSAVVADMLVSFVPGVVIVTSARDAVAVTLRLASHSEKREDLMEWVLLCACLITIALPIAMAAGGAVAAGVGAVVGGIAGTELGAALRAVMLMLIKEASKLVELVRFLQKFIKGDILKFLRAVKFAKYEKALVQALNKICGKLIQMVKSLRVHLESLNYFDALKATIAKLAEWEHKFYAVQHAALNQIPRAMAELDARLAKVLAQAAPKEAHTVSAGVAADKAAATVPAKIAVADTPGKLLAKVDTDVSGTTAKAAPKGVPAKPAKSTKPAAPPPQPKPDPVKPPEPGKNTKVQEVADAAAMADRERITQLSKAGDIDGARKILKPHVEAAKNAKTVAEKRAALDEIVSRLDVTSDKEKMFWSGRKELARKIAKDTNKTILEETAGGKVIDDWKDINGVFSWDSKDLGPHGWDLWGEVSENYAKDAKGAIDIIQSPDKFPKGGQTWMEREYPVILKARKVTSMNVYSMDEAGTILDQMKIDPQSDAAKTLFGVKK